MNLPSFQAGDMKFGQEFSIGGLEILKEGFNLKL
jgi:hypothetical protein